LRPEPFKEAARPLVWENWREPLRGEAHGHGLGNYRIFAGTVLGGVRAVIYLAEITPWNSKKKGNPRAKKSSS